jgi:hypothetical protein
VFPVSHTGLSPTMVQLSRSVPLPVTHAISRSRNPIPQAGWFGLFPVRSPLLGESLLISLPPGTEMFHFPGCRPEALCIQTPVTGYCPAGFPHSEISGSKCVCHSPKLIAAYHVLHRLLVPRHPSHALKRLFKESRAPARCAVSNAPDRIDESCLSALYAIFKDRQSSVTSNQPFDPLDRDA